MRGVKQTIESIVQVPRFLTRAEKICPISPTESFPENPITPRHAPPYFGPTHDYHLPQVLHTLYSIIAAPEHRHSLPLASTSSTTLPCLSTVVTEQSPLFDSFTPSHSARVRQRNPWQRLDKDSGTGCGWQAVWCLVHALTVSGWKFSRQPK